MDTCVLTESKVVDSWDCLLNVNRKIEEIEIDDIYNIGR